MQKENMLQMSGKKIQIVHIKKQVLSKWANTLYAIACHCDDHSKTVKEKKVLEKISNEHGYYFATPGGKPISSTC